MVLSPESAKARPLELAIVGGMAMGRAHTRALVSLVWQLGELGVVEMVNVCQHARPYDSFSYPNIMYSSMRVSTWIVGHPPSS